MAAGAAVLALLGLGGLIAAAAASGKKKKPREEEPPMHEIEGADQQMAALYARLMDPAKTNIVELEQGAAILRGNGHNDWAGNVYSKISSLRATEAAQAASASAAAAATAQAQEAARAAGDAKAEASKAEWEQAYGGRPSEEMLAKTYTSAMDPSLTDVGQLQYAAAVLQAYGKTNEAAQVRARIAKLESEGTASTATDVAVTKPGGTPVVVVDTSTSTAPIPSTVEAEDEDTGTEAEDEPEPIPAPPAKPPPLAEEETKPIADPIGTIKLARKMIAAETRSNWKTALKPEITSWQSRAGLTADGLFGPKSALRMGEEVGILPRVRYWSKTGGTKQQQVDRYRADLNALADRFESDPKMRAHANALRISASAETGQGYPASTQANPTATKEADAAAGVASSEIDKDALRELLKLGPEALADYYERQGQAKETLGVS
jgi:hypothetical protein